jgi:Uma2 family endonuclease
LARLGKVTRLVRRLAPCNSDLAVCLEFMKIVDGGKSQKQTKRSTILLDMPSPALVVEVVSPGTENENRDYRYKRSEYATWGIAEYWIIDPMRQQVMVLTLVDGLYEEAVFKGKDAIASPIIPSFDLTASQLLQL